MSTPWHTEETYKGLIQLAQGGLKFGALVNGGAAVALLALIGNLYGKGVALEPLGLPMLLFILGISLAGLANVTAYITQLRLYQESLSGSIEPSQIFHVVWLWISVVLVLTSVGCFFFGAYLGTIALTGGGAT